MHEFPHGLLFGPQCLQQPEDNGGGSGAGVGIRSTVGTRMGVAIGGRVGMSVGVGLPAMIITINCSPKKFPCISRMRQMPLYLPACTGDFIGTLI